jgi:hypothetical protein
MEPKTLEAITSAVAPVVMVSATGLLLLGFQTKNLHLADRIRTLTAEYRALGAGDEDRTRRAQLEEQLSLFDRRIRLNQRALELLYVAIVAFVLTSLMLAGTPWVPWAALPVVVAVFFVGGVTLLLLALVVEFLEMRTGLATIGTEIRGTLGGG